MRSNANTEHMRTKNYSFKTKNPATHKNVNYLSQIRT